MKTFTVTVMANIHINAHNKQGAFKKVAVATTKTVCRKCGTPLNANGLCKDVTCPFSDKPQRKVRQ